MKLVLIDGNSLLHRAYHAYPSLTVKSVPIGAVYGFTRMLLSFIEKISPTHMAVAWDVGKIVFRHEEYKEYKAGRPETDKELVDQVDKVRELVRAFNIPQFGINNFEADDIIGTIAEKVSEKVVIVTGDRDALQLIKGERIVVYMPSMGNKWGPKGDVIFDEKAFEVRYKLKPDQIRDLKALMGDSSDNIPGVKGVGEKTAMLLLEQASTVEQIYKNIDKLSMTPRIKSLLIKDREMAFKSKRLVTIKRDVDIDFNLKKCELADYDRKKVIDLFEELEFKSLVERLPADNWEKETEEIFS
jgi:DNA polymerase I